MICKNCGGNYRTRELICPYCGTENLVGKLWMAQRTEAELAYERARKEAKKKTSPYVLNRAIGRLALIMGCLCVVMLIGVWCVSMVLEISRNVHRSSCAGEIQSTKEMLYEQGRFEELYAYMDKYDLFSQDDYAYSQAALMVYDYDSFVNRKLEFAGMDNEEKQEDSYCLESILKRGADVCHLDLGLYDELDPMNEDIYNNYCTEIKTFWQYYLGMTEEEIDTILKDDHPASSEYEELTATLMKRRAWEE